MFIGDNRKMANNKFNTTAKGDAFEEKVYNIIQNLLQTEQLPLNGKRSTVYKKKHYKSKETNSDIIIDISIETTVPGSNEIAFLTLIECKDYSSSITVEKMRDFEARIKEIGAHKGYFFTTSNFQRGARENAKRYNIGIAVVNPDNMIQWILRRISTRNEYAVQSDVYNIIMGQTSIKHYGFVAEGETYYTNFYDFLCQEMGLPLSQPLKIDYRKEPEIYEILCNRLDIDPSTHSIIMDDELLGFITNQKYELQKSILPEGVLGTIDFDKKIMVISNTLKEGSVRWRFTVAHEIGHIILHSDAIIQAKTNLMEDYVEENIPDVDASGDIIRRMEIQANMFASLLLLPPGEFLGEYYKLFQIRGIRNFPYLQLDSQPCNINLLEWIKGSLAAHFNVSKASVEKRLQVVIKGKMLPNTISDVVKLMSI